MFVAKVKRVVNPRRKTTVKKKAKKTVVTRRKTKAKKKRSNPVSLLTLGFAGNPRKTKRKKNNRMATKAKPRKSAKRSAAAKKAARTRKRNLMAKSTAPRKRRSNPKRYAKKRTTKRRNTRVIVMAPKRRNGKRRNPQLFGMNVSAGQAAKMVAAGLVGVTVTKLVVPQLPASLIQTPIGAAVASIAVAIAGGWLIGKWDTGVGGAFAFGGLMQAGSIVLNAVPIPGASQFALAGGRGMGYFTPGSFPVPQIPVVTTGASGVGGAAGRPAMNRAYPRPYSNG